ncbi:MAG: hypothetical protein IPM36_17135 [Lewinellaceae bacterium]|nr:hypothetical protein [Lewinellaceae bacterium]
MQRIFLTLFREFKVAFLYIRNLLAVRSLNIGPIGLRNESQYDRPRSTLYWEARGCHRIEVAGYGSFPGNIKGVSILAPSSDYKIHIVFKGVNNRIYRALLLQGYNRELTRQFSPNLSIPDLASSNFHIYELENDFSGISINCDLSGQWLHVDLKETYAEFLHTFTYQQTNFQ